MENKLNGWKSRNLNMVERFVVAKSILEVIPTYYMRVALMLTRIIKKVEQVIKNFT